MSHLISRAIEKGAKLYGSISGGKDGQAMVKFLYNNGIALEGLIHADLGRIEWPESMLMCRKSADEFKLPLHIITRTDGRDMVDSWKHRLVQLKETGKPFWSSSTARYCTAWHKIVPIDKFLRNCGHDFVISCEGIRGGESSSRGKKMPLTIREGITSTYYDDMSVEEAVANFKPGKRLALTWFPIFNYTLEEVWSTYGMTTEDLGQARLVYKTTGLLVDWWPFHPAYAYGNDRVSCMFCVLGSLNDLQNAAHHNPSLLDELIGMEEEGDATFKNKWSLKQLL